jgi:hypothetical protein
VGNVSCIKLEATISDMTFVPVDVNFELPTYRQICSPFEEMGLIITVKEVILNAPTLARPKRWSLRESGKSNA